MSVCQKCVCVYGFYVHYLSKEVSSKKRKKKKEKKIILIYRIQEFRKDALN